MRLKQVLLLVWKNFLLQKRRKLATAVEIALPTFFFLILLAIRAISKESHEPAAAICSMQVSPYDVAHPFSVASDTCQHATLNLRSLAADGYTGFAFAPNTPEVRQVMQTVKESLDFWAAGATSPQLNITFVGMNTQAEVENIGNRKDFKFIGAVVFYKDANGQAGDLGLSTPKLHYQLRFASSAADNTVGWATRLLWPQFEDTNPRPNQFYANSYFLMYQSVVDRALSTYFHPDNESPDTTPRVKMFPFPAHLDDMFIRSIRAMFPLLLILSYIYTALSLVRSLVLEKQKRLKEAMKMMGLANWVHWLSWFIKSFIFQLITIILITIIFFVGNMLHASNVGVVFIFLMLYSISTIAFCFMLSTFFSNANVAAAAGGLLFFLAYMPYFFIAPRYDSISQSQKTTACLLSPTCIGIGAKILSTFEANGVGLRGSTLSEDPSDGDHFTMASVFGMLILDTLLYLIITWYVEAVYPGQFGTPRPPLFFLQREYWFGTNTREQRALARASSAAVDHNPKLDSRNIEPAPSGLTAGISIRGLRKVFETPSGPRVAVDDVYLDMYDGHVTALLGHNGAGKTTMMSMLVGLFPPTAGTALIDGHNIIDDIAGARASLGMCPQFDVLFDELTVAEHLAFFGKLKGATGDTLAAEVDLFVHDLGLDAKRNAPAGTLSGGQKRALSVAIAFVGGSRVVILDEPTSGMDPFKRRQTWDLIIKHKANRTILLTTHFMDEADILGDRIAILAEGQLRCVGSSLFLKGRFGVGYRLNIAKEARCDPAAVLKVVQQFVPTAELVSNIGAELTFMLPWEFTHTFAKLFTALDADRSTLAISSYGVSVTTMEEVFLKVGHGEGLDAEAASAATAAAGTSTALESAAVTIPLSGPSSPQPPKTTLNEGNTLLLQQFRGMFVKRLLHSKRHTRTIVAQMLLPVLFAIIAMGIALSSSSSQNEPCRDMSLNGYARNKYYVSARDVGGDTYSDISSAGNLIVGTLGAENPNALQNQLASTASTFVTRSAVMGTSWASNATNWNMTDLLLEESADYLRNRFFKSHMAAASFERGYFLLRPEAGSCDMRVDGQWVAGPTMTMAAGHTYQFLMVKPNVASTATLRFSTSATDATVGNPVPFNLTTGAGEKFFFTQSASLRHAVEWTIDASRVGQTVYYWCDAAQTNGIAISITNDATTATVPTSATGYAWFNMQPYHTAAQSLNIMDNIIAQTHLNDTRVEYLTYNCPLPKSAKDQIDDLASDGTGFNIAIFLTFGMSFLLASFVLFVVTERVTMAKHIQIVSGVHLGVFWTAAFLWDLINVILPAISVAIVFAWFNVPAYRAERVGLVFFLIVLLAWGALPMVYSLSFLFRTSSSAFAQLSMALIFVTLGQLVAVFILALPSFGYTDEAQQLRYAFLVNPVFAMCQGLLDMFYNYNYGEICTVSQDALSDCLGNGYQWQTNYAAWADLGVGKHMFAMFLSGVFWFGVLFLIETGILARRGARATTNSGDEQQRVEDEDVASERARVERKGASRDVVVVDALTKVFNTPAGGTYTAVDGISLGIPRGECFGLLGVNGAGKTTTFRMLTGDLTPTSGSVQICGFDLRTQRRLAQQKIGYCAQFDGLIETLTGRELLVMFARLRGVPEPQIAETVTALIAQLDLVPHADKLCGSYSGGTKRKLSTAIAVIGDPPVVFLDEPTTGMDPASRRFLWSYLMSIMEGGRSIVLTSHSMEECEALCTRLAIMVAGRFKCLGSTQHLKSRFSRGFTLNMKMQRQPDGSFGSSHPLRREMARAFPGCDLLEEHNGELRYAIGEGHAWADVFARLETIRTQFHIADYNVAQTTLEQIFLQFAAQTGGAIPVPPESRAGSVVLTVPDPIDTVTDVAVVASQDGTSTVATPMTTTGVVGREVDSAKSDDEFGTVRLTML